MEYVRCPTPTHAYMMQCSYQLNYVRGNVVFMTNDLYKLNNK